jgi:hypothetical protein
MKRYILKVIPLILLIFSLAFCAKPKIEVVYEIPAKPESARPIQPESRPRLATIGRDYYGRDGIIKVIIPRYAFEKMHDHDEFSIEELSPNIHLYYYSKEGPSFEDPGHVFAIIMDRYGRKFYLFQSTIKTEQRFFIYKRNIPVEVSKLEYRNFLWGIIEEDRQ